MICTLTRETIVVVLWISSDSLHGLKPLGLELLGLPRLRRLYEWLMVGGLEEEV